MVACHNEEQQALVVVVCHKCVSIHNGLKPNVPLHVIVDELTDNISENAQWSMPITVRYC